MSQAWGKEEGGCRMKTTAICKFDGKAILLTGEDGDGLIPLEFNNYEQLKSYCAVMGIQIEIEHYHQAGINHG